MSDWTATEGTPFPFGAIMPDVPTTSEDVCRDPTDLELGVLQFTTVLYYLHESNPDNGLVRDKTEPNAPVSIAAVGMALATIPVLVERRILIREFAAKVARKQLRFLYDCPQGSAPDTSGYRGFFYHFLDIESGRRVWQCELSTIDSALLFAGALTVATYFDGETADEAEIRRLANDLYCRADWNWARDGGATLTHGWRPEDGFLPYRWEGYDEGLLLYILGLGSPTHPLPPESYAAYCATYQWNEVYGRELLYSAPLFTHQLSHLWIDFRHLRDAFMREHNSDYFINSRHATFVQQEYAVRNPRNLVGYGKDCWGFTASDGPGWMKRSIDGVEASFLITSLVVPPLDPTTVQSPRGWSLRPCLSLQRSSSPRSAISLEWIWGRRNCTVSSPRLIKHSRWRIVRRVGGSHPITSDLIRDLWC